MLANPDYNRYVSKPELPIRLFVHTINMDIEFDPAKDRLNQRKHGLSLAIANRLDWNNALYFEDKRRDYGEPRYVAYARLGNRLFCTVFTSRHGAYRIISLRKANTREVQRYVSFQKAHDGQSLH